jgi:hypothetical protein
MAHAGLAASGALPGDLENKHSTHTPSFARKTKGTHGRWWGARNKGGRPDMITGFAPCLLIRPPLEESEGFVRQRVHPAR